MLSWIDYLIVGAGPNVHVNKTVWYICSESIYYVCVLLPIVILIPPIEVVKYAKTHRKLNCMLHTSVKETCSLCSSVL